MDRQLIDHFMHTFCHVQESRRFSYGADSAWLCHRCAGIYSSFLFFALLAKLTHWRGTWTARGASRQVYGSAALLLALCGIQVWIQQFDGDSGGGPLARFTIGAGVGLALLQVAIYFGAEGKPTKSSNSQIFVWLFFPLGVLHLYLQTQSYGYHLITSLPGLVLMYAWINVLALGPWLKAISIGIKSLLILLAIALEWLFLFYMNVGRYHV